MTPRDPALARHLPASVANAFDNLSVGVTPPYPEALCLAKVWAVKLYGEVKAQEKIWIPPHITVQGGGDVVFEWWRGRKSLSVFVSVNDAWFLQSGGTASKQTEGSARTKDARRAIWEWLTL